MIQTTFLDGQDLTAPIIARARHDNPATSHEAAAKVEASGKATSHRNILANFVREHPGLTNGEIAESLPEIGYQEVTRRMGEIASIGLIQRGPFRICSVHGTRMTTWLSVD